MNLPKKLFCRCFQAALRIALPVLPYRDPLVLDKIEKIPDCLKAQGIQKVLIVTDSFTSVACWSR